MQTGETHHTATDEEKYSTLNLGPDIPRHFKMCRDGCEIIHDVPVGYDAEAGEDRAQIT